MTIFKSHDKNPKKKTLVDFFLIICVNLLFIGGIGGLIAYSIFKIKWISVLSFISFLPMVNVWIWQWLEDKKNKIFATKVITITAIMSVCTIIYVLNMGGLGKIPIILALGMGSLFLSWTIHAFVSTSDIWWQKALVIIAIAGFIFWMLFIRAGITTLNCDRVSDIVYTDIFENLTPPIVKKDLLKEKGTPDDINVDYEEEDDGDGGSYRYKVEVWEYVRDTGNIKIAFIDDDYNDGYINISPTDLYVIDLLKDASLIRNESKRAYKIVLKAENSERIEIRVNKDNTVRHIWYASE